MQKIKELLMNRNLKKISNAAILRRVERGMDAKSIYKDEDLRITRHKSVKVFGKMYENLSQAVKILRPSASYNTIKRWLSTGISYDEAFRRESRKRSGNSTIYLIECKLDGKKYVGATSNSLEERFKFHIEHAKHKKIKNNLTLHAAIKKFKPENFHIKVLEKVSLDNTAEKEKYWIKKLNTLKPILPN